MNAMLTDLLLQHQLPESLGSRLLRHFEDQFRSASEGLEHVKLDLQTKKGELSRKLAVLTELYLDQRVDYAQLKDRISYLAKARKYLTQQSPL